MANVLTDADIDGLTAKPASNSSAPPKVLSDADIDSHDQGQGQGEQSASSNPFFQRTTAMAQAFHDRNIKDYLGNASVALADLLEPEIKTLGILGTGGAVVNAGKALASGAARPAIGLVAGGGTAYAVDKAGRSIGLPPWLSDLIAAGAGAKVGGSIAPENLEAIQQAVKSGGLRGFLRSLVSGESAESAQGKLDFNAKPDISGGLKDFYPEPQENLPATPTPRTPLYQQANPGVPATPRAANVGITIPQVEPSPVSTPKSKPVLSSGRLPGGPPIDTTTGNIVPPQSMNYGPPAPAPTEPMAAQPAPVAAPAAQPAEVYGIRGAAQALGQRLGQDVPTPESFLDKESTGLQIPQEVNARAAIAQKAAQKLYDAKLSLDHIKSIEADPHMGKLFWDNISQGLSKQAHYSMKQATIDATKDALAKLIREDGPTPPAPSAEHMESLPSVKAIMQDPKKLAAAKAFADAIYGNK